MGLFDKRHADIDEQATLAFLLRKQRPVEQQAAVQEVYLSTAHAAEKIRRIRALDGADAAMAYEDNVPSATQRDPPRPIRYFGSDDPEHGQKAATELPPRRTAARTEPAHVPPPRLRHIPRSGYFRFLFRNLGAIIRKNAVNPALRIRFFPPRVEIDAEVGVQWITRIQPVAQTLQYILAGSEVHSWKYLEKTEYNTIRVFMLLLHEIHTVDPGAHLDNPQKLYEHMKPIEDLLRVLRASEITVDTLTSAVRAVADHRTQTHAETEDPVRLTEELLSREEGELCIWSILSALHCVMSRNAVTLNELVVPTSETLIPGNRFMCTDEVNDEIALYLKGREEAVGRLEKEYSNIVRVRSFIRTSVDSGVDTGVLHDLFKGNVQATTLSSPVLFVPAFVTGFLRMYGNLLDGTVRIDGIGSTRLFPLQTFHSHIMRLELVQHRLDSLRQRTGMVEHSHVIDVMHGRREATEPEAEASHQLSTALDTIQDLQRVLSLVIRNPRVKRTVEPSEWAPRNPEHYAMSDQGFPLDHFVQDPVELSGRSVSDHFHRIMQILYVFRHHYRERKLLAILDREHQIRQEMRDIRHEILRIAHVRDAEQIFRRHRLLQHIGAS